jgi:glyoxylate reductase
MKKTEYQITVAMAMHPQAVKQLKQIGKVECMAWDDPYLVSNMIESDALITYTPRFDQDSLRLAKNLKVISGHSCPETFIPIARQQGIIVTVVPSLWSTVADFTIGLIFAAARNIPQTHREIMNGHWNDSHTLKVQYSGLDVFGKTLGIIGLGRIGSIVARRLSGFDMHMLYYDIERKSDLERSLGIKYQSLDDLLTLSDFIIILAPLNSSTIGMFGKRQFDLMKHGAILVNTGRGALIDEEQLYQALVDRKLAGAALDVYVEEPLPKSSPLLNLDNVILAPHLGGSTYDCDMVLVEDAIRVLLGQQPLYPI